MSACGGSDDEPSAETTPSPSETPSASAAPTSPAPTPVPETAQTKAALATLTTYLNAFADGKAAVACSLETDAFARKQVEAAVEQKLLKAKDATCVTVFRKAIALAKASGADFSALRTLQSTVTEATPGKVTIQTAYPNSPGTVPDIYGLVLREGRWLVATNVSAG